MSFLLITGPQTVLADDSKIPLWVKEIAGSWYRGDISDSEFMSAIKFLLENKIIKVENSIEKMNTESIINIQTDSSNNSENDLIIEKQSNSTSNVIANFVDTSKNPQHYVDRYNNENSYKDWFDKNYPNMTIYDAVGLDTPMIFNIGSDSFGPSEVCGIAGWYNDKIGFDFEGYVENLDQEKYPLLRIDFIGWTRDLAGNTIDRFESRAFVFGDMNYFYAGSNGGLDDAYVGLADDFASCGIQISTIHDASCINSDYYSKSKSGYDEVGCIIPNPLNLMIDDDEKNN